MTVPPEAFDYDHPDHSRFVEIVGQCRAIRCPAHGVTLPLDVFSDVLFVVEHGGTDGLLDTLRDLAAEQGHPTEAVQP